MNHVVYVLACIFWASPVTPKSSQRRPSSRNSVNAQLMGFCLLRYMRHVVSPLLSPSRGPLSPCCPTSTGTPEIQKHPKHIYVIKK
ncbi:hypothetical protein LZ30DRAFT_717033 [Colletotrichum cereale]|nr:hypothetical protein LZ30DRAFT_717033 [Colletotrichum cereale]